MNIKEIGPYIVLTLMGASFMAIFVPVPKAYGVIVTITGWNVPSGTTFGNGLVASIMPLLTMSVFAALPMLFEQRGDAIVTLALIGLTIGSLAGMLSLTASNASAIPFSFVIVSVLLLAIWIWRGNG